MTELTDAEVFGSKTAAELSDAEVLKPRPAALVPPDAMPFVNSTTTGGLMKAFGQGFREASGDEPLGLSDKSKKYLSSIGIFAPEGASKYQNPFHAFNEGVIVNTAAFLDGVIREFSGSYRGLQGAGVEAGLHRDIVSIPDAFMGSPGALGEIRMRSGLPKEKPIESGIKPPAEVTGERLRVDRDPNLIPVEGEPAPPVRNERADIVAQAQDLGVIGPERPSIAGGSPRDVAERAIPAEQPRGESVSREVGGGADPWRERFDGFVGRLEAPADVQNLIRDAATENGNYLPARQGEIPLSHVENIAEAAGVDPTTVDPRGLGRTLKNDNEVRVAMRLMLQVTEDVRTAAAEVRRDASPENLIKLQEAIMRRDMAVEQVVGLRAEWGRTGNVFQEFLRDVKDQQGLNDFLKNRGRNPQDLRDIADALPGVNDPHAAARILNDMRGRQMGPIYYTWVNGLISGILTHTKYVYANALYSVTEHGLTTPIASLIGAAKKIVGAGDGERVFFGEALHATLGLISATPTAFIAAARSIKAGVRPPLESEIALRQAAIARGERVPAALERAINPAMLGERPISGVWGRIVGEKIGGETGGNIGQAIGKGWGRFIGAPGDAAGAIHTFFKILGERAGIEAEAYRAAAKEGLSVSDPQFEARRSYWAANPTEEMRERAVAGAYKGTFMQELGPRGKAFQKITKELPGARWVFPFTHIPVNLLKATYEHTPLAVLDGEMRADILGKNGGARQDKAIARMVVGSSIMGYFVAKAMNGQATGDYPKDPKERDAWKLAGKMPNSMLVGDHWVSYARFGPAGDLAGLGANMAAVVHHLQSEDDDAMTKATMHATLAAAKLVIDEAGFQSLANLFEAYSDPDKRGAQFVASQASSLVPFSSLLGQSASYLDPNMRQAKSFVDGLKYRIPVLREALLPKRDWAGVALDNPQYHSILRNKAVNTDPVDAEMAALGIHPAPPQDRIRGVKLPPVMYDSYQDVAGQLTRSVLNSYVQQPGWYNIPAFAREEAFRSSIKKTRELAAGAMQMRYPQLIQQGVDTKVNHITGAKPPPKLQDQSAP